VVYGNVGESECAGGEWMRTMVMVEDDTVVTLGCSAKNHGRKVMWRRDGWILFMTSNIPVTAENKSPEESFKAKNGAPAPHVAVTPAMVMAVSVILLMKFKSSVFHHMM